MNLLTRAPRILLILAIISRFVNTVYALDIPISRLGILRRAYGDVTFTAAYDNQIGDYLITISQGDNVKNKTALYWANGKMLSAEALPDAALYWSLFYPYPASVPDPAHFTDEYIKHIRDRTSVESRKKQEGTSMDFFDAIYDASTRGRTEQHIKRMSFFGNQVNVHERIMPALRQVEREVQLLATQDTEVRTFLNSIARVEGYNWREITDRSSRSFHSYGIAIDILPNNWGQKNIYWAWRRDKDPDNWMLLPLDRRWMPPASVISTFEKHGFIWGGKWMVWDNMHFEYHPELLPNQPR